MPFDLIVLSYLKANVLNNKKLKMPQLKRNKLFFLLSRLRISTVDW
jgi:hypothetical protein